MTSRSMLVLANGFLIALVLGVLAWMFLSSLTPLDTTSSTQQREVDISRLQPGEVMSVEWEEHDVRILRRTPAQTAWLQRYQPPTLADRRADELPSGFDQRLRTLSPDYLVISVWRGDGYWRLMETRSSAHRCDDFHYTPKPIRVSATTTFPGGFYCASMHPALDGVLGNPRHVYDPAGRSPSPDIQPLTVPHYRLKGTQLVLGDED